MNWTLIQVSDRITKISYVGPGRGKGGVGEFAQKTSHEESEATMGEGKKSFFRPKFAMRGTSLGEDSRRELWCGVKDAIGGTHSWGT